MDMDYDKFLIPSFCSIKLLFYYYYYNQGFSRRVQVRCSSPGKICHKKWATLLFPKFKTSKSKISKITCLFGEFLFGEYRFGETRLGEKPIRRKPFWRKPFRRTIFQFLID